MKEHDLKCWPSVFAALLDGSKTFEFRRNDRDFAVGDVLRLREWDPAVHNAAGSLDTFAQNKAYGRELRVRVTYIAHGGRWGIPENFCVMAITPLFAPESEPAR